MLLYWGRFLGDMWTRFITCLSSSFDLFMQSNVKNYTTQWVSVVWHQMRKKNSKFTRPSETTDFFSVHSRFFLIRNALSFIWVREAGNCTENNAEISLNMIYWCCLLFDFAASTLRSSLDNFIALLLIRSESLSEENFNNTTKVPLVTGREMKWFIIIFVRDSAEFCCWFFCVSREHINFGNQIFFLTQWVEFSCSFSPIRSRHDVSPRVQFTWNRSLNGISVLLSYQNCSELEQQSLHNMHISE